MDGSKYTLKLVHLCTPHPTKLIVMYDKQQRRMLCPRQVYNSTLDGLCNYPAFYKACCRQTRGRLPMLSGLDKQLLVRLGGLSVCVSNVALVSLAACCKALKSCNLPAVVLDAFEQLRSSPATTTVLPTPDHVQVLCAQPSPNPVQLQMSTPFPLTLPECQLPADYKQRHGLHAKHQYLVRRAPFSQQMAEFKAWCTNPFQLDRKGCSHTSSTWYNSEKGILLFAGYCHHYHQIAQPTLQLFLSTPLICQYVSFHMAAKHSHLTIKNFLTCAKRVLRWWQTKPGGKHPSFVEGLQWLETLGQQVILWCLATAGCTNYTLRQCWSFIHSLSLSTECGGICGKAATGTLRFHCVSTCITACTAVSPLVFTEFSLQHSRLF